MLIIIIEYNRSIFTTQFLTAEHTPDMIIKINGNITLFFLAIIKKALISFCDDSLYLELARFLVLGVLWTKY